MLEIAHFINGQIVKGNSIRRQDVFNPATGNTDKTVILASEKDTDDAVRAAKERLAVEYDITMEQIDDIINDRVAEEADKAVQEGIQDAISQSVSEAIQQSVGEAMSAGLVAAIEEATGEAIDDALEQELADAIDAEIARAVEMGIEEAAVTAGWQAYFDTLARGGTEAEANANAYEACGSACDNY